MKKFLIGSAAGLFILAISAVSAFAAGGFDQYGYNDTARIFNGTGSSWCLAKGLPANCIGIYSPDKLVMKWNAEWDRGNAEGWTDPAGYDAWLNNEWNGKVKGGSDAVWHYKIVWVGSCGADYTPLPNGGYCIWGQFEVLMDQGVDPNFGPGHMWFTHAIPNGYGSYR
ncbi:hypothetical protein A2773_05660 [Candidatus Gottesmanbacteria bacterium RIFCSPHIGHO2_01_FULL_39_10]|uniref:Secreted protein n=1 Tax=Candidatus Gottesmanbacteria bacterium RIFCSPHIGHO2_01_FULL_39_10 TaxID=1798375 RepID=A0A1F5ZN92_9BACT|nr:MAG: hypothetical protein A2773_05660 [Candidatus Gottesmanbacteria bacterium RIFCSPHIGHO2_01_FULL_39_10]